MLKWIRATLTGVLAVGVAATAAPLQAAAYQVDAPEAPVTAVNVETIARGLRNPWGVAFIGDGQMVVTERPGRMRIIASDGTVSAPVEGLPEIASQGQGGLLDVVTAPDFASSRQLFFTYAEPRGGNTSAVAVARARLNTNAARPQLEDLAVIFRQQPAVASGRHFGSRIVFRDDGTLFVTFGDRGISDLAQELTRHWAKVIRINPDGSVPKDNPFIDRSDVLPEIWSNGHRNIQGAARDPSTGALWTVEHGAQGGDEINIPEAGRNYGWPVISYGRHYSGAKIGVGTATPDMEQPVYFWDPSIAPSGMTFYGGELFPQWKGNLFVGALKFQMLVRLVLDGTKVVAREHLLEDLGQRIRDVRQGPDGALYVLTDSGNGRLLKITPAGG